MRLVAYPSLLLLLADKRKEVESVIPPVTVPFTIVAPYVPRVVSIDPPNSCSGNFVVMLMTPAEAFFPNNVDCGPLNTSTISIVGRSAIADAERVLDTPSIYTPTAGSIPGLFAPLPKPLITKLVSVVF